TVSFSLAKSPRLTGRTLRPRLHARTADAASFMASSCFAVPPAQTSSIEISSMNPLQPPQEDVRSPANAEAVEIDVAVAEADLPALGREPVDARVELIHRAAGDRAVVQVDSSVARVELDDAQRMAADGGAPGIGDSRLAVIRSRRAREDPADRRVPAIERRIPERVRRNPRLDVLREDSERAVRVERLETQIPCVVRVEVSRVHEIRRDVGLRPPLEAERVVVALVVPRGDSKMEVMLSRVV